MAAVPDRCAAPARAKPRHKLGFYKLRAKVAVENISDSMGVLAVWDGEPASEARSGALPIRGLRRWAGASWCPKISSRR
jgi:hypothetical protein